MSSSGFCQTSGRSSGSSSHYTMPQFLNMDDAYDMRGARQKSSQVTMDEILKIDGGYIFQGGEIAACNLDRLLEHNIKLVVNCTNNVPFPNWKGRPGTPDIVVFAISGPQVRSAMMRG